MFGSDNIETTDSLKKSAHPKGVWMTRVIDLFRNDHLNEVSCSSA